jgi:hypothetical protein
MIKNTTQKQFQDSEDIMNGLQLELAENWHLARDFPKLDEYLLLGPSNRLKFL